MVLTLQEYKKGTVAAKKKISGVVSKTPLVRSNWLSKKTGCNVYLKMESEQVTRSFKLRGATNKLKTIMDQNPLDKPRIIAASSGNHGLACAYLSTMLKFDLTVYTAANSAANKDLEIKQYPHVDLVKFGSEVQEAEVEARRVANEEGSIFVSPYNDNDIVFGQGTIGMELLEQLPELDAIFVSVGGGSMIGGISAYIKACKPSIEIIGCQPVNDSSMYDYVKKGYIMSDNPILDTFSSGTAGRVENGSVTFDLCRKYVDKWVLLEEEEIEQAVFDMLNKEKKVVEGAAGLTVAAIQKVHKDYHKKNVALIICGGNIGVSDIKRLTNKYSQ